MAVFSMAGSNPALPTYPLQRSVRLRSSASAYFNRTFTTPTNNLKWTFSAWVKRGALAAGATYQLFGSGDSAASNLFGFRFGGASDDQLYIFQAASGVYNLQAQTAAVFRDPSAWYHIVLVYDSANATSTDRIIVYVNNVRQTITYTTGPFAQNTAAQANSARQNNIGAAYYAAASSLFDGYLTEVNFIDGQALTPSSFGAYNSYGVWSPAKYTGTYGTNGFYLNFQDNSALTTTANVGIGKDSSGNGNYWTSNNISITAGTTYDSMLDVPTLSSATNSNYATLSPLQVTAASIGTLSNANLSWSCGASGTYGKVYGTMSLPSTGQYYWEVTAGSTANLEIGIISASDQTTFYPGYSAVGYVYYQNTGQKVNNNVYTAYGSTYTTNDVIGVAFDATAGTLTFYKNNVSQGTAFTSLTGTYVATLGNGASGASTSASINFGQRPFSYTPPTGFNRLCTYNLPDSIVPVGAQYMAATTFTGVTGGGSVTNTVNGIGFQPDMVWLKTRSTINNHELADSVRGTTYALFPNLTNAEVSDTRVSAFSSNGFSYGTNSNSAVTGRTSVGWQWRASNASAVTNTSGSITSSVSANQTAGFSIVTYTGTGANATVGHGLGVAPRMIIVKQRSGAGQNWAVYHSSLANTGGLALNLTNATITASGWWNNTSPTSSVFSLGGSTGLDWFTTNQSTATYVAYCFAAVPGYSAFGSYTGNGSADGPFVYLGFRPRYLLIKRTDSAGGWYTYDSARSTYNLNATILQPNLSDAEWTGTNNSYDFLSNGFKNRGTGSDNNASGGTYIYMAFSENPFKNALAR